MSWISFGGRMARNTEWYRLVRSEIVVFSWKKRIPMPRGLESMMLASSAPSRLTSDKMFSRVVWSIAVYGTASASGMTSCR